MSKIDLDCLHWAGSDGALPVTLVSEDLNKASNDAVDVGVEALQAEDCQVAPVLVARHWHIGSHIYQAVIDLQHNK